MAQPPMFLMNWSGVGIKGQDFWNSPSDSTVLPVLKFMLSLPPRNDVRLLKVMLNKVYF